VNEREACVLLPKQQEVHNSEVLLFEKGIKREARCTKALAYTGSGKGSHHFGVLYAALPWFLHKGLFPGLEPVTFQSRNNNFNVASRLTL